VTQQESSSNDVWILGAGPFQRGTIYEGTAFAGRNISTSEESHHLPAANGPNVALGDQQVFTRPAQLVGTPPPAGTTATATVNVPNPLPSISEAPPAGATDMPPANAPYARIFSPGTRAVDGDGRTAQVPHGWMVRPGVGERSGANIR
jgi:hypothetical protein